MPSDALAHCLESLLAVLINCASAHPSIPAKKHAKTKKEGGVAGVVGGEGAEGEEGEENKVGQPRCCF